MTRKRERVSVAPVGRVITLIILSVFIYVCWQAAFGWSLSETERFMVASVGPEWAYTMSLMVQVGPNSILVLRRMFKNHPWIPAAAIVVVVQLNGIDWISNWSAYYSMPQTVFLPGWANYAVRPFGYIAGFAVTWFEEVLAYLAAAWLQTVADLMEDFGLSSGRLFFLDDLADWAETAGGKGIFNRDKGRRSGRPGIPRDQMPGG